MYPRSDNTAVIVLYHGEVKRIFLIFHGRMPSEKAASLWAAKTAEGLARQGLEVVVLVPHRGGGNPFETYRLEHNFVLVRIPIINLFNLRFLRRMAFAVSSVTFTVGVVAHLLRYASRGDVMLSNEPLPMAFVSLFFKNCFYELHVLPVRKRPFFAFLLSRMSGIFPINHYLGEQVIRLFSILPKKVCVVPGGVELQEFNLGIDKKTARSLLGLPPGRVVLYTGHLYGWKGTDTLAAAAPLLPPDVLVVFVGGTQKDIAVFAGQQLENPHVYIAGHQPHDRMPLWLCTADVVVLPNTAKKKISKYYTSPMKLFEYMAAGRPIVASRLPSIEEIVSEEMAVLVEPDNPKALAVGIYRILNDPALGERLASAARLQVKHYTWVERGARMAESIRLLARTKPPGNSLINGSKSL